MKAFLLLALLAVPLRAEVRGAARAGVFAGAHNHLVGTLEIDARYGPWSIAPALELIRGGHGLHAIHSNVRRLFNSDRHTFWVGAGPTFVRSNNPGSDTTWNFDAGLERRTNSAWTPFVAARYYSYEMPAFRERLEGSGAVLSIGISRRVR